MTALSLPDRDHRSDVDGGRQDAPSDDVTVKKASLQRPGGGNSVIPKSSPLQSLVTFSNSQGDSARGTILRLSRSTVVFEVYNPYSIVQLSEVLDRLTIRRGDRAIYSGRGVVTNLVNTGLMLIVSVTLTDTWSDLSGLLTPGSGIGTEVRRFIEDYDTISCIRSGYQLVVGQLRTFLAELGRWLEQVDLDAQTTFGDGQGLSEEIFMEIGEPLFPRLASLFADFEDEAQRVPDEFISYHKAYAQRDLHPLLLRAPFIHRSFAKPLGYAGDFEMVNMMLRNEREGPNTYAQILHAFYVHAAVCQAHRNRIDILTRRLEDSARGVGEGRALRVLNVGCGPAHEILRFIRTSDLASGAQIELVDFSQVTLDATRVEIERACTESGRRPEITYFHDSVHQLLKRATRPEESGEPPAYDLIYCAGLFDYLSDRVCSRLIKLFNRWVRPGGLVMVTNVHPDNDHRGAMEHLLEWYLIYRDEQQMVSLSPPDRRHRVYRDTTGLNVFLEMRGADLAA
jgi:extracellular factor (EF) 3-hydroxypalmitic acid methyl ester biosynthesis protein